MARIRSIKPDLWVDERFAECSMSAGLTFVGLQNFCDDRGVHPAKVKTLKAELFPMADITASQVGEWVGELIAAGLVREFVADETGDRYWHVVEWDTLQKIDRPSFKHPAPPALNSTSPRRSDSPSDRRVMNGEDSPSPSEDSPPPHRAPPPGVEGSGLDGNGLDGNGGQLAEDKSSGSAEPTDKEVVFRDGVPMLVETGTSEKSARSLLASFCRDYGDATVRRHLQACSEAQAGQPVSWLKARMPDKRAGQAGGPAGRAPGPGAQTLDFGAIDYSAGVPHVS